nr:MAG TPA: membrane-anchored protein [Caudoviricetes sp.]
MSVLTPEWPLLHDKIDSTRNGGIAVHDECK